MAVPEFEGQGIITHALMRYLLKEDLIPEECVVVAIDFPIDSSVQITYKVNLTEGRLKAFHRAFTAYLEALR